MITRFGQLRAGDKFVSFYHTGKGQDSVGKTVWIKSTESMAHDKEGGVKKFDKMDSVFKLKKTSTTPPLAYQIGGEA